MMMMMTLMMLTAGFINEPKPGSCCPEAFPQCLHIFVKNGGWRQLPTVKAPYLRNIEILQKIDNGPCLQPFIIFVALNAFYVSLNSTKILAL